MRRCALRAVLEVPGRRGRPGRRRPGGGRLQRGERRLRRDALRRVRGGLRAARHRRRPAGRAVLRRRHRRAADAVRPVPATALGARRPGVPGRVRGRPAADGRAAAARLRRGGPGRGRRRGPGAGGAGAAGRLAGARAPSSSTRTSPPASRSGRLLGAVGRRRRRAETGVLEEGPTGTTRPRRSPGAWPVRPGSWWSTPRARSSGPARASRRWRSRSAGPLRTLAGPVGRSRCNGSEADSTVMRSRRSTSSGPSATAGCSRDAQIDWVVDAYTRGRSPTSRCPRWPWRSCCAA